MSQSMTLAVMAAGMGSRYGGAKQIDRLGASGEILMEYGIYDAIKAGFDRVVVILKDDMLADFKEIAGERLSRHVKLDYAFQRPDDLPEGFSVPEGRVKPWGTAQAVASLRGIVGEPFCVINADDFYGAESYKIVADFLRAHGDENPPRCCMAGYKIENTLSENGSVTRGMCTTENGGRLVKLTEVYKIRRRPDGVIRDEETGLEIPEGSSASMNMFGFAKEIPRLLNERFGAFLKNCDPIKGEYLLPSEISALSDAGLITVDVLPTPAKWYGVTYREDREPVVNTIKKLIRGGAYPEQLWG